ncbi:cation-translocating P-type ATPase [Pseudophaeobacter sp. EL27]|uniref:heavy metal translocating P-type ATPase n=1 Tax=Pseudophaeobacter sp. EL27 TaxID=2107580 RepID=UPI000EFD4A62|nr:heavy metal translocating P-type ATPase [Pseudophaeobacter sp. EL27]
MPQDSCCSTPKLNAADTKAHVHSGETTNCCNNGAVGPAVEAVQLSSGRSFRVNGLCCAEEVATLNRVLGPAVGGADHLGFDVLNGRMTLLASARQISDEELQDLVAKTGMQAKPWEAASAAADQAVHLTRQKRFTTASALFWGGGLAWHVTHSGAAGLGQLFAGHGDLPVPMGELVLFLIAVIFGVWLVLPKAWYAVRNLSPDMNLLMVVAVAGALGLGEFFEAATVAFFFALSLTLESWSVGRARTAVSSLLNLAPPTARVIRADGSEVDVPADEVQIGQRFVLRGGDRIPMDGQVISGTGAVDQAPITGESALVTKEAGDEVYAGTLNGEGSLTVEATKLASDTVLAKITRMVGEAHARRAPVEQWVSKFARIYTPSVLGLAIALACLLPLLAGGDWGFWFYNALVLLVIACPCALVISTPVSIVAALAAAARAGVLIKGGAYIEAPGKLEAIALDKTGTLTEGRPEVAGLYPLGSTSIAELLQAAAALEARASHPLALAILAEATHEGLSVAAASESRTVPGRGVEGRLGEREIWLGSSRFAAEKGFAADLPEAQMIEIEASGATLVVVGDATGPMGLIALRDRLREGACDTITALHQLGVKQVVMLTGDNAAAAGAVARDTGIDAVHAGLLPADKLAAIEGLTERYNMVAMMGDGVNDAPAMARAHFAVVMGAVGSDAAIETADIALMSDDISRLPWLIAHSRRTMAVIHQNIGLSLVTKLAFALATAFGLASMWGAIAADVGVSLLVVGNALRLLKGKEI